MTSLPHIPPADAGDADVTALAALDENGLFMAPGESEPEYLARLHAFSDRMRKFKSSLAEDSGHRLDDLTLTEDRIVPSSVLAECADRTESDYAFRAEWVPAFYVNPRFSWLFGGCAYYSMPDMFVVVILRRAFGRRRKWLFYDRNEILAHEMCHAARMSMGSRVFEERLAYQVSDSRFRKRFGGLLHSQFDTLAILGSTFLLLGVQMMRSFMMPGLPILPFWMLVLGVFGFLLGRDRRCHRMMRAAVRNLRGVTEFAEAVAFRCSDAEIAAVAALPEPAALRSWIHAACERERRWQVIVHRFIDELDRVEAGADVAGGAVE